eukprot:TRINITY_DN32083_c0_g1_i1.p1 TRINITY_DN32083_c0_g1~~TRINITY_DN32083_c0_g1_i1.p1  ORF type:complete len:1712 (+),score=398.84 TRINITY_DN32083_c0_g1_i1:592-5136(+)
MANRWLDVIESKGKTMTDDEVIHFFSESKSMSKSVEQSGSHKSVQATTVRRLAEFLGVPGMLKDAGISCHLLIANKPHNASNTERAIPVKIFSAEESVKKVWLRHWLQDSSLTDFDMRSIIDWDYYKERLCAVFQKLISIPASYQKISNPCPRVKVPEWLRKRVAEQNDRFQQRSLGLWLRKTDQPRADDDPSEAVKRKLGDMEDLAGTVATLPVVEFGSGPKKWLEVQRMRWAAGQHNASTISPMPSMGAGWRASLFDDGASWLPVNSDVLHTTWHIVAVEPAHNSSSFTSFRVGDTVMVEIDIDDLDDIDAQPEESTEIHKGTVSGFVGGMVRVLLDSGEEQLVKRSAITPVQEEGLFSLWVASGQNLTMHRCEVLAKRRVVLALESDFSPEGARTDVRPADLAKGLRVWPKQASEKRVGPGVVTSAAPEIGLCGVTWYNGESEAVFAGDLERQCGSAAKVLRDAPRNMQHNCLVELELSESDFQAQRSEGALGDRDSGWPRVDSIYEAEMPLQFDFLSRLGPMVKLTTPEKADDARGRSMLRLNAEDLLTASHQNYLRGLEPTRIVYLHLCFDRARPSRAFCGIYAPALAEAWACFGGLDPSEGEAMRHGLESQLSEQLAQAGNSSDAIVRTEVSFVGGKSLHQLVLWAEQRLQEIRKLDGGSVCVICSTLRTAELRGLSPSVWLEQRQLRHVTALREMPICRTPCPEGDSNFPALDWPRWISRRFVNKVPHFFSWWRRRVALCRAAGLPICNAPEIIHAVVPPALDVMYSRQLQKDSQLRWASPTCRPDLGETSLALVDAQESSVEAMNWVLQGKDLAEGRGGGQINNPGVYRSICLEVNLKTKLCICALQHARFLSDMEGGELSKKLIRKVNTGNGEVMSRNMDHTSEASVTSLESLVTMVQDIAAVRDSKEAEIVSLRKSWASQSQAAKVALQKADIRADNVLAADDSEFIQVMVAAGCDDSRLAAKLEELRSEYDAQTHLLDGLYGWLASPTSLLYDPALLRRVQQYMDKVLKLFVDVLKRNGCKVIHASYTKVLFETGKFQVAPDINNFWRALCENVESQKALKPLVFDEPEAIYYGIIWLDPSDWAGIPINLDNGEVIWKVQSSWKLSEFLPPAVRPSLVLYAGDLLLGPQRELGRRFGTSANSRLPGEASQLDMEVDAEACEDKGLGNCEAGERDEDMDEEEDAKEEDKAEEVAGESESAAAEAVAAKLAEDKEKAGSDSSVQTAKVMEEIRTYVKSEFFEGLRRRVLRYQDELQAQKEREVPSGGAASSTGMAEGILGSDSEEEDDDMDEDERQAAKARRQERLRKHLKEKWDFPDIPGRKAPPETVDVEFMRAIVQVFMLEECIADEVSALRDRMCQKSRVSSFKHGLKYQSPCFPLILRDVTCPWCQVSSHIDITSHTYKGPGLWECCHCERCYDKDTIQAQLVDLLHTIVQAWQSQEINCRKCKGLREAKLQTFCECFGRFQVRFSDSDFRMVLRVLRSLTGTHDLPWLKEMLDIYSLGN